MKGLELLTTLYSDIEAQLIKEKLADSGIESFIQHSDFAGISGTLDSLKGIRLFVEPYDLEKAALLITDATGDLPEDMEVGIEE